MRTSLEALRRDLAALADPVKARVLAGFFKTAPGQYGHGDVFLGIPVPRQRTVVRAYRSLPLNSIATLLASDIHEHRLTALLILIERYRTAAADERNRLLDFYLSHLAGVNNWDLVDVSAPAVLGDCLLRHGQRRGLLMRLARSENLWERRIAVVATFAFIRNGRFAETLRVARLLLADRQDLIHKAVGWMLREVGKRDPAAEHAFLKEHAAKMPRTMLRYAIERFPQDTRRAYMAMGSKGRGAKRRREAAPRKDEP
jgi:3-methyladenine DNA glycosylase AlkD